MKSINGFRVVLRITSNYCLIQHQISVF